ncbi:MAG: carboxypeptidase regulatory-like domain-containing protein, partial [Fibrobacter sp.]|nr:carboxypeptidase regulatory-like domain-containing protein [Fibrobacter sp.]
MSEIGVKKFTDMQRVMRLFKSETKLLFQILFVIFMLISTAGAGYFNGTVYNDMGKFEPDVTIEIYAQGKTVPLYSTKTDPKGFFKFDSIVDDRYQIRIIPKHHPAQWYSTGENTLFPQNYIWIGSVTVPITLMKDPIDNSPASIVKVSVYDESGTPVGDICCINLIQSWDNAWVVGTNLDSNSIVFSGLHPSQYALFMNFPPYPSQYYNATGNSVQKSNFTVSGSDTTFIRFYLTMYPKGTGYISGRCITDKGVPAAGVSLSLFKVNDTTIPVYSQITLTDGTFGFNYILPENYYLKISGNDFPVQWYSRARAQTVTFPEDPVKTSPDPKLDSLYIAVTMSPLVNDSRAVVSLKVMDSTGTLIKDSGVVQLIEASSQIRKNLTFDPVAQHYKADMVAAGNYSLFLNIPGYNPQYYAPTGNTLFESHKFFVNPEDTLSLRTNLIGQKIDTMLSKSMITGIVSDSGKPYKGANLKLFDNKGVLQNQAISDSSGIFTLNVSTGGAYYLVIEAPGYPLQFWTGKGSTLQIGIDDYFTVASGITFKADISLIRNNIVKTDSSMISGIITDKITGKPVPFLRVILIPSSLIFSGMDVPFLSSEYITQTDISGSFKFTGIPLNTYWLAVYTDSSGYISQFYPGFDSINNATRIILSSSTSKVTANMAVLPGGIIRGVVQNNVGQPVSDVHVNVLLQNSSHGYSSKTDSNGVFQVKGLRTGTYKLEIYSKEYILRESIQKEYQVTEGMTTDINSIVMVEGGYVSGTYYYSGSPDITAGSYLNGAEIAMVPDTS